MEKEFHTKQQERIYIETEICKLEKVLKLLRNAKVNNLSLLNSEIEKKEMYLNIYKTELANLKSRGN